MPSNTPMKFIFWSDSNLANFKQELQDSGVNFESKEPATIEVYDSNPAIKTLAADFGGDVDY